MKSKIWLLGVFLLLFGLESEAQTAIPAGSKLVTLDYDRVRLRYALNDINRRYDVNFCYSDDQIPFQQRVTVHVREVPMNEALTELFSETKIVFAQFGDQIALKIDENKAPKQRELSLKTEPPPAPPVSEPIPQPESDLKVEEEEDQQEEAPKGDLSEVEEIEPIEKKDSEIILVSEDNVLLKNDRLNLVFLDSINAGQSEGHKVAQVSFLPFLGSNEGKSAQTTNNFSLNLLAGTNGGVDGIEVGGLVNTITGDVRGFQMAGLGNVVVGDVRGTQIGGLFNVNGGHTTGWQMGGLMNMNRRTHGFQLAGLANISSYEFSGAQAAGLFNIAGPEGGHRIQLSGLFNVSGNRVFWQTAGLFNVAGDVESAQVSGFLNVADDVRGVQIGLINVADTVSGVSIGLLNIVRDGYNRIELSYGDALQANLGLKFGGRRFYNILHLGGAWHEESITGPTGQTRTDQLMSWGIGYGFGTAARLGNRGLMNIELVSIHINEQQAWTNQLNLLNQARLTFDWRVGRRFSFFAGGSLNLMVSNLFDEDTGLNGSVIAPEQVWSDELYGRTNIKMWPGFNVGLRL
jgi:hypothetical protein